MTESELLPTAGAIGDALANELNSEWSEQVRRQGGDLEGFDPQASLDDRLHWARCHGLSIGAILTRFSSEDQDSTAAQAITCIRDAATKRIYVPPEYVSADEGITGRKASRPGLNRAKWILEHQRVEAFLIYKLSRLFRNSAKGYQFLTEEIVERNIRGICVTQAIDTSDTRQWKLLTQIHGMADELFLTTTADHVVSGMERVFSEGYVVGALNIGYRGEDDPQAKITARGRPRRRIVIDEKVADHIRRHFQWCAEGLSLREGWRRWIKEVALVDARGNPRKMSYPAYRLMLNNSRYTGEWSFKKKKNVWSSKVDGVRQVARSAEDVVTVKFPQLRIVDDELFARVQDRLRKKLTGPKKRRSGRQVQLWDLVHRFFFCPECQIHFKMWGNHGLGMRCSNDLHCPLQANVDRRTAVIKVCQRLTELLESDEELVIDIITEVQQTQPEELEELSRQLASVKRQLAEATIRFERYDRLLGKVSSEQADMISGKLQEAMQDRSKLGLEQKQIEKALNTPPRVIPAEEVRVFLKNLTDLLIGAMAGELGEDQVREAAKAFELLVGGRIDVYEEDRVGRQWTLVRGTFTPALLSTCRRELNDPRMIPIPSVEPVEVWLRSPPLQERIAEQVHDLVDIQGLKATEAARLLSTPEEPISPDVIRLGRKRWYELHGLVAPPLPHGRKRPARPLVS